MQYLLESTMTSVHLSRMEAIYESHLNRGVAPAKTGEFRPLRIGTLRVDPPVVLAPMAGVTNWPFRAICRRYGAGLYVSEMITARPLVEGNAKTLKLSDFGANESPRSLQLYGTDPHYVGLAVARLVGEGKVDHIDMNFGCPVPKVTRKGGGAAIPVRPRLLESIVRAAVQNAGEVPVTIKFRMGIDEGLLTYLESGRIAQEEGCAAVAMHARTAAELYDGEAHWEAIGTLKEHIHHIPVLGNGDIWEAKDALRMMRQTGCDGVVVGRGCLGRPWLFRDLADVFAGREPQAPPKLGEVMQVMRKHLLLLSEWLGEAVAVRQFRRHASWYTKGFRGSSKMRAKLMQSETIEDMEHALEAGDPAERFPPSAMRVPRGKTSGKQKVRLPAGFLQDRNSAAPPEKGAELLYSGG